MMSTVMVTVTTCNQKEKIQRHMSIVEAKASQYSGKRIGSEIRGVLMEIRGISEMLKMGMGI
jgi:tetrahydromethanopterin S-methyltransferase subunit G